MHPIAVSQLPGEDNKLVSKEELIQLINTAKANASKVLEEEKRLLIKIADYLSDNSSIDRAGLLEMAKKYSHKINIEELTADKEYLFFRNHLKKLAAEV